MAQSPPSWDVFFTSARSYTVLLQYGKIHVPTPEKLIVKVAEALRRRHAWLFLHPDIQKGSRQWYEPRVIDCYQLFERPLLHGNSPESLGSAWLEFPRVKHYLFGPRYPGPHELVMSPYLPIHLELPEERWDRIFILNPVHTIEDLVGTPQRKVS